jgi:hypothetical protein
LLGIFSAEIMLPSLNLVIGSSGYLVIQRSKLTK